MTDSDLADALYGDANILRETLRPHVADSLDRLSDAGTMTSDQRDAFLTDAALAFNDADVSAPMAPRIFGHIARGAISPPDEATSREWAVESRRLLRETYGEAEADRRLKTVREFLGARPRLQKLLNDSGAGDHPDVVVTLAESAHRLRMTPTARPIGKSAASTLLG